jgi:hypothetical protein
MTPPRSFGVFAPVGYLVLAFQEEREAAQVRESLLTGGYDAKKSCSSAEAARVLRVAGRFGARLAHKYNRMTVEEMPIRSAASRKAS